MLLSIDCRLATGKAQVMLNFVLGFLLNSWVWIGLLLPSLLRSLLLLALVILIWSFRDLIDRPLASS